MRYRWPATIAAATVKNNITDLNGTPFAAQKHACGEVWAGVRGPHLRPSPVTTPS